MSVPVQRGTCSRALKPLLPARSGLLFMGVLAAASMAISAQEPVRWTRIAGSDSWKPDASWGPLAYGRIPRLITDGAGGLYLSQGDSLFIGESGGTVWKASSLAQATPTRDFKPILAQPDGLVLWGSWRSPDRGLTWTRIPEYMPASYGRHGEYFLAGQSYDQILLSSDTGQTWKSTRFGRTYGNIIGFASSRKGWCFAMSTGGQIQASRDGAAWADAWYLVKGHLPPSQTEGLVATIFAMENTALDQVLWVVQRRWKTKKYVVAELRFPQGPIGPGSDSLELFEHPSSDLPDPAINAITALAVSNPDGGSQATLWLGTWGQGVWVSRDRGETWRSANQGLADLHVEALCFARNGWNDPVLALTSDGLYRTEGATTGMSSDGWPRRKAARRSGTGAGRLRSPAGAWYRSDGRKSFP
jgi:hypothetical protein